MRTSRSSSDEPDGLREAVRRAAAEALDESRSDWHRSDAEGCELDHETASHAVADAVAARLAGETRETERLLRRVRTLSDAVERFQHLAETVREATVWDYTVYDDVPDERWLAIDRDHYEKVVDALAGVDSWEPWNRSLERRLGDV